MRKNLTEGSVFKNIADFSVPYFVAYFLQTLYGMANLFIIGRFDGAAETTAVSIGSQVMHMLTVVIVGLAMGTTVGVAVSLYAVCRRDAGVSLKKRDFKIRKPVMAKSLRIGIPVALQDGFIQVAFIVITIIANRRGLTDAAAVGIVEKVIVFCFWSRRLCCPPCRLWGAKHRG